jgi:peptide-methionine (S)-S-oxide reductase
MTELATVGGGCFWCVEAVFRELKGVVSVVPGYAGGQVDDPTYEAVCGGRTGHAEVAQITFDPEVISYEELLQVFFATHDPTTRNRQGHDVGPQYRSVIFYHDGRQKAVAEDLIQRFDAEGLFPAKIVTEVVPYTVLFPAESYHHDYYARNQDKPYCVAVIDPKLAKLRKAFAGKLKAT